MDPAESVPASSTREAAEKWINQEGFPLEYRTAEIARAAGLVTLQGRYFVDDQTQKALEVDVQALRAFDLAGSILTISLVFECKTVPNGAWIFFRPDDADSREATRFLRRAPASATAAAAAFLLKANPDLSELAGMEWLNPEDTRFAFGGLAFPKQSRGEENGDAVYRTLNSITTKGLLAARFEEAHLGPEPETAHASFAFPVLVLDGSLLEASYDPARKRMVLKDVEQIRVAWAGNQRTRLPVPVDVVTVRRLPAYLAAVSPGGFETVARNVRPVLDRLRKALDEPASDVELLRLIDEAPMAPDLLQEILRKYRRTRG